MTAAERRRSGQLMKYTAIGAFVVGVFIASMLLYINYIGSLERSTTIKSQAAQDRLGVIEEVMNADCATVGRAIFNRTAVERGDVGCIASARAVGLSFRIRQGSGFETYNYSIQRGVVTSLAAGESIRYGSEEVRTFPVVYRSSDGTAALGDIKLAVSGTGWQCRQLPGQCIAEGQVCVRQADADCGPGRVCCRTSTSGSTVP